MEPGTKKLRLRRETPLTASRRRVAAAPRAVAQRSRNPRASRSPPEIRYFPIPASSFLRAFALTPVFHVPVSAFRVPRSAFELSSAASVPSLPPFGVRCCTFDVQCFPISVFVPSRLSVNSAFPRSAFRVSRFPSRATVALTQPIVFQRQSRSVAASRGWGRNHDCRSLRMALSPLTRTRLRLCESLRLRVKIRARKLKKFAELLFCVLYVRLRLPQSATCLGIANAPDFTTE
jgi:hypothetical protein